jgi:hypothetical protein
MRLLLFFFLTGFFLLLLQWKPVSHWQVLLVAPYSLGNPRATASNRTTEAAVLVYNRVPKCSSTSMYRTLQALAGRNNFTVKYGFANDIRNDLRGPGKEEYVMKTIRAMPESGVYVRHMYKPDWRKHGVKVNLVNMVRDPISRMASWFHFIR